MILCPSPAYKTPDLKHMQDQVMLGVCYESAMLFSDGSPCPQIVGPVTYMWRPFLGEYDKLELKEGDLSTYHSFVEESKSSLRRQLWIWIHPAALDEGFSAIRYACEKQMQDSGAVVKFCSLEGKIARLDVMGCKAIQSLKRILHPMIKGSIVLPLSSVKPFWLFLVSHGAHAIGLRERRWIATKVKIPCFPYDYPDSRAYASFMAKNAAVLDKTFECCCAAKRTPRVPVPPLWHCIVPCFGKGGGMLRGLEVDDFMRATMVIPKDSPVNSESGGGEPLRGKFSSSLQPKVPRTVQTLKQYGKEFDMKYLSSSGMEMDIEKPNLASNGSVNMAYSLNELCLTRVLIRAFKEGSFEEGAAVCAPFLLDLSAWKIRSGVDEEEGVEKWELQLPQS